jgi:anti-sigma regulatory factor (Ser/Thr protein kinase)
MREISLHIMDIAENSITAGADCIHILVDEARDKNRLRIEIRDNGKGLPPEMVDKATDPFITTRTTRRVGLGLSLFEAAAQRCEGKFTVSSKPGKGVCVKADFQFDHIDRAPVGDMAATLSVLIGGNQGVDFVYTHMINGAPFNLDTREIRRELEGVSITEPTVIQHLTESIRKALTELAQEP